MTVLGVDVGTTNTKVGVFTLDGVPGAAVSRPTPRRADDLAATVLDAVRRCVADCAAEGGKTPEAVGVTGMAETGVPIDRTGRPLSPLLFWTDPRAAAEAAECNRVLGAGELYRVTGRVASAKSPLATWLRLRRTEPAVLDGMAQWLGAPDIAVRALTGAAATHPTLASRTLAFRLATGDYDADLLAVAGLRPDQFPMVTGFHGRAGSIDKAGAAATGLPAGTPVVNAGHDHTVGAWAVGAHEAGAACLSLGTAQAVFLPTTGREVIEAARPHGFSTDYTVDGSRTCLVGGLATCGALIEWLQATDGVGNRLADRAAAVSKVPTGIVLLPYLRGRAAPAPDPLARLAVHGVAESHGTADLLAAAIEGICLHGRWMTETAAEIADVTPERLVLIGGPSREPIWRRVTAALGMAPVLVTRVEEAVCAGAALRAAAAVGMNVGTVPIDPVPVEDELCAAYQEIYRRFLECVGAP